MKQLVAFMVIFIGTMVYAIAAARNLSTLDIGTIKLVSIELVRALNNPDIMPYDQFRSEEKLLKINFRSDVDLLDFARNHSRVIGYGFHATLCDKTFHYRPYKSQYSTILDSSSLYQSGIDVERQTKAILLEQSSDPRERKDADLYFTYNKKRMNVYYFYIRPHSPPPVIESQTDNDYNLETTPADVCFRLESDRMGSGVPVKPTISSNTIRIPKKSIAEALKSD